MFDIDTPNSFKEEDFKDDFNYKNHIVNSNSINENVEKFYKGEIQKGFEIGIPCFDKHFVCKEKSLYALTGRKGDGKTTIYKIIQLMQSIVNNLVWVVAFQENSDWSSKVEYLQYFLGDFAIDIKKSNPKLHKMASDWIDQHFIFLDVETIEEAIKVTECLIKDGVNAHGLFLDPVNSFEFGYKDTGNTYNDGVYSSKKVLRWCKKNISIHVSQHPNMTAARNNDKEIYPIDAEFGFWNNKAHFTWTVNRSEQNNNVISVHNVREKLTGGSSTKSHEDLIIEWFPTKINISKGNEVYENVIQYLVRKHNPLNYDYDYLPETKEIINTISN
ncbi:hypothetical protein [Polaribacter sp. 11A2H]|uniref:hypothetical protein n=1 Tax=Polaribacter sp. 11A2H TaxID=2687290 RepID=UPI001408A93A|nr:hypothetical protein [Polaribacter sp. 11A2H]